MKIYKTIVLIISCIILFLLIAGFFISLTFKKNAIHIIKKYTDDHLITEISVCDFNFSLYRKFPNATIVLQDVYAKSTLNFSSEDFPNINTDTLLYAKSIFFEFDLLSILRKKYILKNIQFNEGKLNILTDYQGDNNYNIWVKNKNDKKSEFTVNLKKFTFKNFTFQLNNLDQNFNFYCNSNKINASGNFSSSKYALAIKGDCFIKKSLFYKNESFNNKNIDFNIVSLINDDYYSLQQGVLNIDGIPFEINGYINKNASSTFSLNIYSHKIKLQDLLQYIPAAKKIEEKVKASGYLELYSKITGKIGDHSATLVICNFKLDNGTLKSKTKDIAITDFNLTGNFNSKLSLLTIDVFKGKTQKSNFNGNYRINDFKSPDHELNIEGIFYLPDITNVISIPVINVTEGFAKGDIHIKAYDLKFDKITNEDIAVLEKKANLMVENAYITIIRPDIHLKEINGKITVGEKIDLEGFSFNIFNDIYTVDLSLSGLFKNILQKKQAISINGNISSDNIDLREFSQKTSEKNSKERYMNLFPDNIITDITLNTGSLKLKRFNCDNLTCRITYNPGIINIQNLSGNILEGALKSDITLNKTDYNSIHCISATELNNINISKLFSSFNNFNQNYITNEHLKGYAAGNIIFNSSMDTLYKINKESVECKGNITINNGELINFTPMLGLSNYFKEEQLKYIKFKTFNSTINIKNEIIYIAETNIHSSLINISGNGTHNFNNEYTYYLNVNLSDFLFKRFKKNASKEQEWMIKEDNDNKLPHPLIIKGKGDKYILEINKIKWLSNFKNRLYEERQFIKNIIRNDTNQQNTNGDIIFEHDSLYLDHNEKRKTNIINRNNETYNKDNEEIIYQWDD